MKSCENFTFNGIKSRDIGVCNVFVGDAPTEILSASSELNTARAFNGIANQIQGITTEVLSFTLKLSPLDGSFNSELINKIYNWLHVDHYCRLSFANARDFYYMCVPFVGSASEINLYIKNQGYFEVTFVCDSCCGYTDELYEDVVLPNKQKSFYFQKKGIAVDGNNYLPMFVSTKLTGKGNDKFEIHTDSFNKDDKEYFTTGIIPANVKQIDMDVESGVVVGDNADIDYYPICGDMSKLYINSLNNTTVRVENKGANEINISMAVNVPCMAFKDTVDLTYLTHCQYVGDGLTLFYDGLTGYEDGFNTFTDCINEKIATSFNKNPSINSDGGVVFDNDLYCDTGVKLENNHSFTLEAVCRYNDIEIEGTELIGDGKTSICRVNNKHHFTFNVNGSLFGFGFNDEVLDGKIYYLTAVCDIENKKCTLYENGVKKSVNFEVFSFTNDGDIYIGDKHTDSGMRMNGSIYCVRTYNRALTEREIHQNHKMDIERYESERIIRNAEWKIKKGVNDDFPFIENMVVNYPLNDK